MNTRPAPQTARRGGRYDGLIPEKSAQLPGLEVAAGSMLTQEPAVANTLGGNLLDVTETAGGFSLVLADIAMRGERAAALIQMAKHLLRAEAAADPAAGAGCAPSPEATVREAGRLLALGLRSQRLALLYAHYDPGTSSIRFCNCSPWRPILVRQGRARLLGEPGTRLGGFEFQRYPACDVDLIPGDLFVGYTSGLPEARQHRNFLGVDAVCRLLEEHSELSPHLLVRRLLTLARGFSGLEPPSQDAVVLVARCSEPDTEINGHRTAPRRMGVLSPVPPGIPPAH